MDLYDMKNQTEAAVNHVMDTICATLPQTIQDSCTNWISTQRPELIKTIADLMDAADVCLLAKQCP